MDVKDDESNEGMGSINVEIKRSVSSEVSLQWKKFWWKGLPDWTSPGLGKDIEN